MDSRLLAEIKRYNKDKTSRKLVAILGTKGVGKDAAIENVDCHNLKFAEALKRMLYALYMHLDFAPNEAQMMLEGKMKETPRNVLLGNSSRSLMQTLGTEWGRKCVDDEIWLMAFLKGFRRTRRYGGRNTNYVVTDCRFPNEYELLKELGATFIRITRPSLVSTDEHISETALDGFPVDHEIINDGTIEDLQNKVGAIINGS